MTFAVSICRNFISTATSLAIIQFCLWSLEYQNFAQAQYLDIEAYKIKKNIKLQICYPFKSSRKIFTAATNYEILQEKKCFEYKNFI